MPTQAEIYAALGFNPSGMPMPLPNTPVSSVPSQVPSWMNWGGFPDLMNMLPSMDSFMGANPWPLAPGGNNPAVSMPPAAGQNPWDMLGPSQVNEAPSWAHGFRGNNPISFDNPLGDAANLSVPGGGNYPIGVDPLSAIVRGLRGADRFFRGPAGAEAAPQGDGLPPLTFGDYSMGEVPGEGVDPNLLYSTPFDINSMPGPMTLEAPPEFDMSKLEGAKKSSILGALASGAASVSATEGGSFARALAAAGGAGSTAAGESQAKMADVEYKNALNAYNVAMKNKELEYEHAGRKWEMMLPNMQATKDGVVVSEFKDGNYEVRAIPTGGMLQSAEEVKKLTEAMGGDGPAAEALSAQYIINSTKDDPVAMRTSLLRGSIEHSFRNGTGLAVFGKDKANAAIAYAKSQIDPTLMQDPEQYNKYIARAAAAFILSDEEVMKDLSWLNSAERYGSVFARVLLNGQ